MKKDNQITEVKQEIVSAPMTAETLIAQAIDRNIPVETMAKLLDMRRELKAEQAKEAYDRAMANFQANCPTISKNATAGNGSFGYKYAPLEHIVEKVKSLLSDNGFSYTFDTEQKEQSMKIICKVKHQLGHMEVSEFELAIDKSGRMNASQQYGSALTYGKRYAFCNAFGIVIGGEDNDAQSVSEEKTPATPKEMRQEVEQTEDLLKDFCPLHNVQMKLRTDRNNPELTYYDHRKNENNIWYACTGKGVWKENKY